MSANMRSNLLKPVVVVHQCFLLRIIPVVLKSTLMPVPPELVQSFYRTMVMVLSTPVAYFSKKFLPHQKNYSTIEKEALALLLSLQHFEVYVGSSSIPVLIFTDHNPLVFLSRMRNANQRLMRWSLFIQDFNLEICYKKGKDNVLADALSRSLISFKINWKLILCVGGMLRSLASLFSCVLLCVTVYVCRDWLFIKERDWWILKRVTLKGRRYQHTRSSLWGLGGSSYGMYIPSRLACN